MLDLGESQGAAIKGKKIKIKIDPEPILCKIIELLQVLFLSNVYLPGWK